MGIVRYKFRDDKDWNEIRTTYDLKAVHEEIKQINEGKGYGMNICLSPNCGSSFPLPNIVDHYFEGEDAYYLPCGATEYKFVREGSRLANLFGVQFFDSPCPGDVKIKCRLTVSDLQGNRVMRFIGDCPLVFVVDNSNEGKCPDGFLRCECSEYPGYSCKPCGELLGRLSSIENKISNLIT